MLEMRFSFLEREDSECERKWIVVGNEIGLIVLQMLGVEHNLYSKSHVTDMVLFPDLYQIGSCLLYLALREQCNAQVFHDQQIIRSYSECTLEEDDAFFDLTDHRICPPEITEDFWIIGCFQSRFFEILDSCREIVFDQGNIATQIQASR